MSFSVRVTRNTLDGLDRDLSGLPVRSARAFAATTRGSVEDGNRIGKAFAKESAGSHGKLYPRAWSGEMTGPYQGEYGPDAGMPQGGMSFEMGSRNQKPHLDLARSADIVGPLYAKGIGEDLDGLFW